ncbi:metal-dependent hydrolase [Cellulomonas chitinilytica]|uniref:Metal-dependent hydrolase n=1 Tax=Cellulomonas chitinilytica TaxID=398759 RepID=A0A919U3H8_9CELL|nr:endonuclease/exonuclease/phosphatase family protein [Cellulomonas chitinilytica]GIG22164.1 metal-dependent hydrolase [Cellulomonas chitinilytica]
MTDGRRMRLMTYNVKGLSLDRAAVVEVVRAQRPDVLALQEPPRGPAGRWRLRRFAAATGLVAVVNGRGARTTALLVAPGRAVSRARALRLPWRFGTTRRGVSVAVVDDVRVVVVHLSLHRVERAEHLERLVASTVPAPPGATVPAPPGATVPAPPVADAASLPGAPAPVAGGPPTVVLGDLNELPGGPAWLRLGQVLTDVAPDGDPTFPAGVPRKRIDAVLVSAGIVVERVLVPDGDAARRGSDHRPVVVDLVLAGHDNTEERA